MDIEEMRNLVRLDLHDVEAVRWTDAELDRNIAHALSDYSEHIPHERTTLLATVPGFRSIDVTSVNPRVCIAAVEYPVDAFPPEFQPFSLWGDELTLLGDCVPEGSDVRIYYGSLHVIGPSSCTVPSGHYDIIAVGACGYAALAWAAGAVNRINTGGTGTSADYLAWGREKLSWFRAELRRLGRRDRVRSGLLYAPAYHGMSKRTDPGP